MRTKRQRAAFTLLEIVLALAILAGALAALGEVLRLASQNAEQSRDETRAQLLASSVMAELASGARQLSNVNAAEFALAVEPRWEYGISIEDTVYQELLLVRVQVAQQLPPEKQPTRFELVRWFANPDYAAAASAATAADESSAPTSADVQTGLGTAGAVGNSDAPGGP